MAVKRSQFEWLSVLRFEAGHPTPHSRLSNPRDKAKIQGLVIIPQSIWLTSLCTPPTQQE
jgi:hypothetical protein